MEKIANGVLWSLALVAGILFGGALYETTVLQPVWAGNLPESVRTWQYGAIQEPFFRVLTPGWAVLSLATLAASSKLPSVARPWARAAGAIGVAVFIWTLVFFIPRVVQTQGGAGAGLTDQEITRLATEFVSWGYVRLTLLFGAWLMALRAAALTFRSTAPVAAGEPSKQALPLARAESAS